MEVIYLKNVEDINLEIKNLSLVLGYFDGVHIGHSQLISFAKSNCEDGYLGVLTFDKPLKSIEGALTDLDTKIELMDELGVDYLFIIVCDDNFKHLSYVDFVDKVLKKLNPSSLFCGPDFKFGYEALGDVSYLKERFNKVYVLNYVQDHHGVKISSSKIKDLIIDGDIKNANRWLGRPYMMRGFIAHGKSNGRTLGFPTANLISHTNYVVPLDGVYITKSRVEGVVYPSITNVGLNPTIAKLSAPSIETYLLGYDGDLYGKEMDLYFYERLRDEIKFTSVEDLIKQIELDKDKALNYFKFKKIN